ncbi:histone acetyltransferase HPA2 [Streptococcus pneumoniae]|nr:histone acetyltransferase HPA2 [Streptococcus pneumoniae]
MKVNIADLHPTQLYLSEKKLQDIQMLYQSAETNQVDPISILAFGDCLLITDGHHRAYQALLAGRIRFLLSGIEMVVMNYIISMRKLARKERFTLFLI